MVAIFHVRPVKGAEAFGIDRQLSGLIVSRNHSAGGLVEPCTTMRSRLLTGGVLWIRPVGLFGFDRRLTGERSGKQAGIDH
jgi:hypothetical protein